MSIKYICDRCKAPCLDGRTAIRIETGPKRHDWPGGLDLCPMCLDSLLSWIGAAQLANDKVRHMEPTEGPEGARDGGRLATLAG